jgi:hypothetical protein
MAADKGGNKLHIFKPDGTGLQSSIDYVVDVPGHPGSPSFYPKSTLEPSYIACMPLTENVNLNNMNANGEVQCSYNGCSQAQTPEDVASGVCLYDSSERSLQEVTLDEIGAVAQQPFGSACAYCENPDHFNEDGICVCTPFCGSCADPNYDASQSGVSCVDLGDVFNNGVDEATLIKGAGAVKQGAPYAYSPQCGFGRTYRKSKRGGKYDASAAEIPFNSLQIVNMETQELKCQVQLQGKPNRVVYVPPQPVQTRGVQDGKDLSSGAIAGIVIGSVVVLGVIALLLNRVMCRNEGVESNGGVEKEPESATDTGAEGNVIA